MMKLLVALLSSLVLIACSSTSKENYYYSLNLAQNADEVSNQSKKIILIKPIQLAPFLNGQGLVMQLGSHQIVTASHHLWAEPLEQALGKLIQQRLNSSCQGFTFETTNHYLKHESELSIQIEVDQFHSTDQSTVVVAGRFWILENKAKSGTSNRFMLNDDLEQDGYLHMVEKLNKTVTILSQEICSGLKDYKKD